MWVPRPGLGYYMMGFKRCTAMAAAGIKRG